MSDAAQEQRFEVVALIGPCTFEEADAFVETVTDNAAAFTLGAVWTVRPIAESEAAA